MLRREEHVHVREVYTYHPQKTFYTIVLKNFPEFAKQLPSLEKRLSEKEAIR